MLSAEETESTKEIRKTVCCKLAEALLYGISDARYARPEVVDVSPKRLSSRSAAYSSGAYGTPLAR